MLCSLKDNNVQQGLLTETVREGTGDRDTLLMSC